MLLVKQGLLLVLIRRWSSRPWRWTLIGWLTFEVVATGLQMGARGPAMRLLISFAVLYHCFVRPIRARTVLLGGLVLLIAFQIHGIVRLGNAHVRDLKPSSVLTGPNEFEALFVTAYDIYKRKEMGTLGPIPWQVYCVDLYLEIPSQLLPFRKLDPAEWYLEVIGANNTGVGFMFGVMAQAVVGLGWIELVLRGALLGALCAAFHRWFTRRAHRFWPTLLYLYVTIWIYYTFRATTFWILHFVVYEFLPVV